MDKKPFKNAGYFLATFVILFLLTLQFSHEPIVAQSNTPVSLDKALEQLEPFISAYHVIQTDFVDTDKIDPNQLIQGAIRGMLDTLDDPHSRYVPLPAADELKISVEGQFGGIGISIGMESGRLTVISPLEGTPAWRAGVEPGDIIVKIDGDTTSDMSLDDAVSLLRGRPGTKVNIEVARRGFDALISIDLTREIIEVRSVRGTTLGDIGYIRMSQFSDRTAVELDEVLRDFRSQDLSGMILDLRHNSGGVLTGAIAVSKRFIDSGVIVSIKSRDPSQTLTYVATPGSVATRLPIVVLINEGSASASEIVAGAIKDHDRGVLVGTKSYGKGSVQTVENLPDGSQIALTTAKYFTPSGVSIHGVGIEPDIKVEMVTLSDTDKKELGELFQRDTDTIKNYFWGKDSYSEGDVEKLEILLKEKNIELSRDVLEWQILRELSRRHDDKMYVVPRLDPQLKKAIDLLKAEKMLSPHVAAG